VAEGARLESVFRGNSNVGSNPTLSAIKSAVSEKLSRIRGSPFFLAISRSTESQLQLFEVESALNRISSEQLTGQHCGHHKSAMALTRD
jgi:hypothetical protein